MNDKPWTNYSLFIQVEESDNNEGTCIYLLQGKKNPIPKISQVNMDNIIVNYHLSSYKELVGIDVEKLLFDSYGNLCDFIKKMG